MVFAPETFGVPRGAGQLFSFWIAMLVAYAVGVQQVFLPRKPTVFVGNTVQLESDVIATFQMAGEHR